MRRSSKTYQILDGDMGLEDRQAYIEKWIQTFGSPPPRYTSVRFMRRALAYEDQCREFGGLSATVRRVLKAAVDEKSGLKPTAQLLRPGTHLVREWNGRTYQVEVVEEGFLLDGRSYGSLTAIAKRITGTNWSGPRFFGLLKAS